MIQQLPEQPLKLGTQSIKAVPNRKVQQDTIRLWQFGSFGYLAVFDGHGGSSVSRACARGLHADVKSSLIEGASVPESLSDAFMRANMRALVDTPFQGSTASVFMWNYELKMFYHANVGDSTIVLNRGGRAVQLSEDHNCFNSTEVGRLKAQGAEIRGSRLVGKCAGKLAVTRAIGDREFKPDAIAVPHVGQDRLLVVDEFAIVASDGLWDVVKPQEAVDEAAQFSSVDEMVDGLISCALERGSKDNIAVGIVKFGHDATGSDQRH